MIGGRLVSFGAPANFSTDQASQPGFFGAQPATSAESATTANTL